MKKEKLYPYEQIDHAVTGNFGGIKEDWEKLNLTKEHVLELYNHVRTYPKGSSMQTQPFNGKQKNVSLTFKAYHDALSDLMEKLSKYAPIRFMKQYEAVLYRKDNLSGTKTKNGFRYFPISWRFYKFLMKRKAWLEAKIVSGEIKFKPGSEFQKLDDLPIACDGENWTQYCTPSKLTDAGRELFKKIKITTEQMQILNEDMVLNENETIFGRFKDATAYAMRRNMAGHLSDCGCNIYRARYLFGHALEYGDIERHHFINDDEIKEMHELLSNRPLANDIDYDGIRFNFREDKISLRDNFHVTAKIETVGREGQVLVVKVLPREPHSVTTATIRLQADNGEFCAKGVYSQVARQENDYTGGIIIPRHMVTLYDYWHPYAEEEKKLKQSNSNPSVTTE